MASGDRKAPESAPEFTPENASFRMKLSEVSLTLRVGLAGNTTRRGDLAQYAVKKRASVPPGPIFSRTALPQRGQLPVYAVPSRLI